MMTPTAIEWCGEVVYPHDLRSWSDCRTWADLDYFISARGAMLKIQAAA